MKIILINIIKGLSIYVLKNLAFDILFDLFVEAMEKAAKSTATNIDDDAVAKIKKDKKAIELIIKGR